MNAFYLADSIRPAAVFPPTSLVILCLGGACGLAACWSRRRSRRLLFLSGGACIVSGEFLPLSRLVLPVLLQTKEKSSLDLEPFGGRMQCPKISIFFKALLLLSKQCISTHMRGLVIVCINNKSLKTGILSYVTNLRN